MEIFAYMGKYEYEELVMCHDAASGLKAIICIHDTTLGPALGGTRMWNYASEEEALVDVLRLARGMSYKNAAAGLNLGGAKAVIIGDSKKDKSEAMFRAFGRFVEGLNGRYITAEDVGTTVEDMEYINMETNHVAGLGSIARSSGDPSPVTAYGTWRGIKACANEVWGTDSLAEKTVAVQGLGHVGYTLCKYLHEEGANLIVTDICEENVQQVVKEFNVEAVAPNKIYSAACDIFAPCALGAIINDETIPQLKCRVIAGAANNQLKEARHGDVIDSKGILYAPDFIINAGGVMNVYDELLDGGYNHDRAMRKVSTVYNNIEKVIAIAKRDHIPTCKAADVLAEERIQMMRSIKKIATKY
ncbi:Glu/Leu/Phe/Val family dehydrogenase [Sporomusa acidovorans]|uniref:Leucine dehydrogenase n=1 Tax=Sporomusa acidovorans (strain ATCC 49682 / DSM 3132 / Mol) TaxID=1123286 RepID=A0ABZ3IYD1_SPOA4|nr:Glu/Leu/Phe/Val dehydrogenase [Sporomusa acidovorans]OZC16973.1 leucine dehydrogenase [Sporomusa acidovorans DSM 3132]SDE14098.1 leucine dehydrogenase [Sporomusa acidovorans]